MLFAAKEKGQGLVEYALILVLIAIGVQAKDVRGNGKEMEPEVG